MRRRTELMFQVATVKGIGEVRQKIADLLPVERRKNKPGYALRRLGGS